MLRFRRKLGTHRFYEICTNRLLRFPALADALLSEITGGGEQFTMKRSRNSNEHALAVQKPAPEKAELPVVAAKKKTRKQLIDEVVKTACKVTGTQHLDAADRFIVQVGYALVWPKPKDADDHLIRASALIAEMAPQNVTEAMLATQMIAANDAALMFLRRATLDNQTFDGIEANVHRASRLMRIFNEQLEAMQKLKGKASQQKVTVEHVHVHEGGQAIVGAVNQTGVTPRAEPKDQQ